MGRVPASSARVVLLCGPSGSGKTSLVRRLGLPSLNLDDFYRDGDSAAGPSAPPLPHRFGIVDWDDVRSWDDAAAMACLRRLCEEGSADVPVYDIPTSRRTGTVRLDLAGSPVLVAEGIFAAHLVGACRAHGLLADAVCLHLSPWATFWRRLLRDLAEGRKRPWTLLRRGWALRRAEPALVARWTALGCRPLHPAEAERAIRQLVRAEA